jgi:hypothetical protein
MKTRLSIFTSLVGVNAAIYAVLYIYNIGFPIIGLSSARPISIAESYALAVGYVFGWWIGFLSIAIGGLIVSYVNMAPPFYILNFLPAAVSTLMIGILRKDRIKPLTLYILLLLGYLFYPYVGVAWLYPLNTWFHILILLSYIGIYMYYRGGDHDNKIIIFLMVLLSTLSAQLAGSIMFEGFYYPSIPIEGFRDIWIATTFIYPIERIILAIVGYIILIGIRDILRKYNILSVLE